MMSEGLVGFHSDLDGDLMGFNRTWWWFDEILAWIVINEDIVEVSTNGGYPDMVGFLDNPSMDEDWGYPHDYGNL